MKTPLSVIPAFVLAALVLALPAGPVAPAHAGPYADTLSQCLVRSTTEQDKAALVRWMFASEAQHPAVEEFATVTPERRTELSKTVAAVFERLLTQNCQSQFADARAHEGEKTVSVSFSILVQTALQGLIENPNVSSALAGVDDHLNKEKISAAMAQARVTGPKRDAGGRADGGR